ncbi:unnamed protein product [Cylindrotheca closterium]|uniref:Uncharacterized protein n=1 Tax=Cylindrotheca closterium TaxID=2856 RepID=A0AAD2PWN8_9STRA|nr:unnamed protein product [Cylindrotheca closterium]
MGDTGGDFELMGDLPVHRGEASLSANDADDGGFKLLPDYAKTVTRITFMVATASLLSGVLAMWWCASQVAYIAFFFPLVTAPAVVVQRIRIQWMPTLRQELNKLRSSVNDFAYQNARLQAENTRLEQQVNKLSGVEDRLAEIVEKEGRNVNEFKGLLKENKSIQEEMAALLQAEKFHQLIDAMIASEQEVDNVVCEKEMDIFMRRLKGLHPGRNSSYIDEEALRAAFLGTNQSPEALLQVTSSYLSSKSQETEGANIV